MKKWTSIVLAFLIITLLAVPAGACMMPQPLGPYFSYGFFDMNGDGQRELHIVFPQEAAGFFAYDNGTARRFVPSETSADLEFEYFQVQGYRYIYTDELTWLVVLDWEPPVVHDIIFNFEDFTYTVGQPLDAETLRNDPAWQLIFFWQEIQDQQPYFESDHRWMDHIPDYPGYVFAAGYATDELLLRMLAEPGFVPEPPEMNWESWPEWDDWEEPSYSDASSISWTWTLLAAGMGGIAVGAGLVLIILFIVLKRRNRHAQSKDDISM